MSINTMATIAMAKRAEYAPRVPATTGTGALASVAESTTTSNNQVTSALSVITAYIPTEILTLYVAVRAALAQPSVKGVSAERTLKPLVSLNPESIAFFGFLVATPLVVWLVFAAKLRADRRGLPWLPADWPVWEMFAATIAYVAWGFALPDSPFNYYTWYSAAISAVVVLATSSILGLVSPVFGPGRN